MSSNALIDNLLDIVADQWVAAPQQARVGAHGIEHLILITGPLHAADNATDILVIVNPDDLVAMAIGAGMAQAFLVPGIKSRLIAGNLGSVNTPLMMT